ncbi:antitoxin Xre-like helix-turn-helix domain-containing protein [Acidocella sp.]|uniref:antitoxin Xre-like helix-turn-helix domain-containing protein n=1 Tax=Acidocella sp. TaxID=50710 RepID=UPI00260E6410|nr:antitoxin Xre-like helix-turn-helix domain-containing protein [Acidocella sp.]
MIDLNDQGERVRLSGGALRAFFNIMAKWQVKDDDAKALLGGISNGAFYALKKTPDRTLDTDTLTRISYLVGIFKALHILYGDDLADKWISLPNKNRIFHGLTPLAFIQAGGLLSFQTVRRLLDARRGGV